jgi:hypothetical protein
MDPTFTIADRDELETPSELDESWEYEDNRYCRLKSGAWAIIVVSDVESQLAHRPHSFPAHFVSQGDLAKAVSERLFQVGEWYLKPTRALYGVTSSSQRRHAFDHLESSAYGSHGAIIWSKFPTRYPWSLELRAAQASPSWKRTSFSKQSVANHEQIAALEQFWAALYSYYKDLLARVTAPPRASAPPIADQAVKTQQPHGHAYDEGTI